MSDIPPINAASGSGGTTPPRPPRQTPTPQERVAEDRVEISEFGQTLSTLDLGEDIRVDKVLPIREAIKNESYEITEEKIERVVDRLLEVLRVPQQ